MFVNFKLLKHIWYDFVTVMKYYDMSLDLPGWFEHLRGQKLVLVVPWNRREQYFYKWNLQIPQVHLCLLKCLNSLSGAKATTRSPGIFDTVFVVLCRQSNFHLDVIDDVFWVSWYKELPCYFSRCFHSGWRCCCPDVIQSTTVTNQMAWNTPGQQNFAECHTRPFPSQ